jgi:coenzyme F420 hydrogenase subunit beta
MINVVIKMAISKMALRRNISSVVKDQLCTGCGTCVAICPNKALKLSMDKNKGNYVPRIVNKQCNMCGVCYKVCPGHEVNFKQLNQTVFGKQPEDALLGNYTECYTGYSTDYNIRYNCSSGGFVTALLIRMLEAGEIDGALVTRMRKDRPLEPEPFIARTREEIYEARGSKYCPVPANIVLRELLKTKGGRFAAVGLPCQIQGLRKVEMINKEVHDKIAMCLGLFCSHMPRFQGTKYILSKKGIDCTEVVNIRYRCEGWPGKMKIETKNGEATLINNCWETLGAPLFCNRRCFMCYDALAEFADVSFGDAWLDKVIQNDTIGTSIAIIRTQIGHSIMHELKDMHCIEMKHIKPKEVVQSQKKIIFSKKINVWKKMDFLKKMGMKTPNYCCRPKPVDKALLGDTSALINIFNMQLGTILEKNSEKMPEKIVEIDSYLSGILEQIIANKIERSVEQYIV